MKLRQSKAAKIIAALMFVLMLILAVLSGLSAIIMAEHNTYFDNGIYLREEIANTVFYTKRQVYQRLSDLLYEGETDTSIYESYVAQLSRESTNLSIVITQQCDGFPDVVIFENYPSSKDYQYEFTTYCYYGYDRDDLCYSVTGYLQSDLSAKDAFYYVLPLTDFLISAKYAVIWVSVISAILAIAALIFLMCAAGHRKNYDGIYKTTLDRIPFDLLGFIYLLVYALTIKIGEEIWYYSAQGVYVVCAVCVWVALIVSFLLTTAVRIKDRSLLKNTLIWRLLKLIWKGLKLLARVLSKIHLYYKAALIFAAWTVIETIFLAFGLGEYVVFWVLTRPIVIATIVYIVIMLRRLEKAGQELAAGNTAYRVDTRNMLPTLANHGESLNNLSVGLGIALEERMKSERMKTELITNVSHDIKTPLTSIVNYVDLLKLNGLDSPNAPEYLEVLEKQTARLKKLTEDLIEASRASSGCIGCECEPTNVNVLLSQALGEYEERLVAAGVEPILCLSPDEPTISADGRLLWRVFDNLFSNIRKYSLSSSRAYFSSAVEDGKVMITFKNISDARLDIPTDELTERFVRGDASRHTEGSGLGLSIARSLTELQGGEFFVSTDGDLFKVQITFPTY